MANWYAIYTRPCWEKRVAERLSKRKIENYCPVTKDYKKFNDFNKTVLSPLFNSIVFVRLSEIDISSIKKIEGVINIIFWMERPAVIRDIEIEMIKRFLNEHSSVYLEKATVAPNEIVRIVNGPLMEEDNNVIAVSINKIKLILPTLGYSIIADAVKENVEIIRITQESERVSQF